MALSAGLSDTEALSSFEEFFSDDPLEENTNDADTDPKPNPNTEENDPDSQEEIEPDDEPLAAEADGTTADGDESGNEADGEGDEDEGITSLGALAEFFEIEEDEVLQNLEVEGPDGQPIAIGQALESWKETEGLLETRRTQLETDYQTKIQAAETESERHLAQLNGLSRGIVEILQGEYTDARLEAIRREDPDAWTQAYERRNHLMGILNETVTAFESYAETKKGQSDQEIQSLIVQENQKLLEKKPEWRDDTARRQAMVSGQKYLLDVGFSQDEINNVMDHRLLLVVNDAVLGRKVSKEAGGKSVESLRKRGLKKPSPGLRTKSRKDPENPANRARVKARAQLRKSGDENLAARLIEDLI